MINDAPPFKLTAFNVTLFNVDHLSLHYVMLHFLMSHYFHFILFNVAPSQELDFVKD